MAKFVALGLRSLIVPFIEKDEKGNIIRDQSIVFNQGLRNAKGFVPASYITNNEYEIKYLRANGGNKANGGRSFEEIKEAESKAEAPKAEAEKAENTKPEPTTNEAEAEEPESKEPESKDFPQATTVQEAGSILRTMIPGLKTRDVSSKDKVLEVASKNGITFPNL